ILADQGRLLYENTLIQAGRAGVPVSIPTKGVRLLAIVVNSAGGGGRGGAGGGPAYFDLADAKFAVTGAKPAVIPIPGEAREVWTPKPGPAPKINGPGLTGVSPGRPVLHKIPATGTKPITYVADHLPDGLKLDPASGI